MHVLESVLYGEDLMGARTFYEGVLGMDVISFNEERSLFLRCEGSVLIIFRATKTVVPDAGVPPHGTTGAGHLAFAASADQIAEWAHKLDAAGIPIIETVDWPNGAKSIYFNDPAGNVLEFATPELWGIK